MNLRKRSDWHMTDNETPNNEAALASTAVAHPLPFRLRARFRRGFVKQARAGRRVDLLGLRRPGCGHP